MSDDGDSKAPKASGYENGHSHNLSAVRDPAAVYVASLRPGSRRSTRQALRVVAEVLELELEALPWHQLRSQHTQAVRAALADRYAPATANKVLAALRGVLREARRMNLMSGEDLAAATDIRNVRGTGAKRGRMLASEEMRALRGACDNGTPLGARDLAMLAVLYGGGLRRSEVVKLDVKDVAGDAAELRVRGKGAKVRQVFLQAVYALELLAWVALRGDKAGPLLCPVLRGGRIVLRRLTDQAILVALRRLAERAGVDRFSPHDVRRTYVSELLDAGADLTTVARLAGHSQVTTTARYDRRGERAAKAASELLPNPDGPRGKT